MSAELKYTMSTENDEQGQEVFIKTRLGKNYYYLIRDVINNNEEAKSTQWVRDNVEYISNVYLSGKRLVLKSSKKKSKLHRNRSTDILIQDSPNFILLESKVDSDFKGLPYPNLDPNICINYGKVISKQSEKVLHQSRYSYPSYNVSGESLHPNYQILRNRYFVESNFAGGYDLITREKI